MVKQADTTDTMRREAMRARIAFPKRWVTLSTTKVLPDMVAAGVLSASAIRPGPAHDAGRAPPVHALPPLRRLRKHQERTTRVENFSPDPPDSPLPTPHRCDKVAPSWQPRTPYRPRTLGPP